MRAAIVLNSNNIANIEEDYIIAADAGYTHVLAQGKKPNVVIGDFDSSSMPNDLNVIKLQVEKDDTDGQAAIDYAKQNNIDEIVIYGLTGGRLDHELCNLSLLAKAYSLNIKASAKEPDVEVFYSEAGKVTIDAKVGATVSIIAFGDSVTITDGKGLKYPINNLTISKYDLGRSISNVVIESKQSFEVVKGSCLVFKY